MLDASTETDASAFESLQDAVRAFVEIGLASVGLISGQRSKYSSFTFCDAGYGEIDLSGPKLGQSALYGKSCAGTVLS